jgi:pyrimidine operon attenuation protein/uracil phosphoribosyltransferase
MSQSSDIILNHQQISHKLTRLAWQVYENNMDEAVIWIAGIDQRGMYIAKIIASELAKISEQKIQIMQIELDSVTLEPSYQSDCSMDNLSHETIVLVDDVLNTGKTLMMAMMPLVSKKVRKIQVAVLASRSHRLYPIRADFVGTSMATTLQEHLNFDNSDEADLKLILN